MGITSNDIAAQRAMLERGEEKRKADWKLAERERLRDTFAAAALTGLLSNVQRYQNGPLTEQAFEIADFMLKERERTSPTPQPRTAVLSTGDVVYYHPTHDAVPEACVQQSTREPERSLLAQSESAERGLPRTGNTPSEAEIDALEFVVEEGRTASVDDYGILRSWLIRLRPEWESQSYDKGDEKRTNTTMSRDATPGESSVQGKGTLTESEREAIEQMLDEVSGKACAASWVPATLRSLLERLK